MKDGTKTLLLILGGLALTIFGIIGEVENAQTEVSIIETKDDSSSFFLVIGLILLIAGIVKAVRERGR